MNPAKQAEDWLLARARRFGTSEQRAAFLRDTCGEDVQLLRRLEARLQDEVRTGETGDTGAVVSADTSSSPAGTAKACIKPGSRVGHYQVVRYQGAGGMGEVYLAQDTRLGRLVALKFLPPTAAQDAARRQRFFSEARAAAALDHPNICTVYDVAETDDAQPYIAMEWLEGPTLKERMAEAPFPAEELLRIGLQVAEALEVAHARGIVHRDLKPANVSLTAGGLVKVLDFGLAKWQPMVFREGPSTTASTTAPGQTEDSVEITSAETAVGQIVGSPGYMSPEQAAGKPVDQQSDLFSLGVILYEMATGRQPFAAASRPEVLRRTVEQEPEPWLRLNETLPPELERIVMKCLRKDPRERYRSATELHSDLAALQAKLVAPAGGVPGQVVTLLCLEIPETVSLKQSGRLQEAADLLRREQAKLRELVDGAEVSLELIGETFLAQFGRASEAVQVALRVVSEHGPGCRMAIHLGEVLEGAPGQPLRRYGMHLETVVRLTQLAAPGQVLLSRGAFDSARVAMKRADLATPGALSWVSHGQYAFEGVEDPLEVCEVLLAGRTAPSPPPTTAKARRVAAPEGDMVLGWRPAVGQEVPNTKWVLEEKLGEGGFGEVWKARHEKLEESRVFKFCFAPTACGR